MAQSAATPAPETPTAHTGGGFVKRELNGATFLTLEHVAHMALVVVVPLLALTGVSAAISLWFGWGGISNMMFAGLLSGTSDSLKSFEAIIALGVVAALLVLVPALVILDRRTRAEWHKRPGYAGRLAYKVPVYTALAVLGLVKVIALIEMLYVVIVSLALLGIANAPIGTMYLSTFLPATLALLTALGTGWYVFKLAKGRDNGRMFSMIMGLLGAVLVVALLITSIVTLHSKNSGVPSTEFPSSTTPSNMYDDQYYQDMMNKYYQ